MKLEQTFDVGAAPHVAYAQLLRVSEVCSCVPGATHLRETEDGAHEARIDVHLGPVSMSFQGLVRVLERRDDDRFAAIESRGHDVKGRGHAIARSEFEVKGVPTGGSQVTVRTELTLGGPAAQYGRASGVIDALSRSLVNQFAANLNRMVAQRFELLQKAEAPETFAPSAAPAPPLPAVSPLSLGKLLWQSLRDWLAGWWPRGARSGK